MEIEGWYYLHTNGDLIFKRNLPGIIEGINESDFCKSVWPVVFEDRANAWTILVESLSIGAKKERVFELAEKWGCNDEDGLHYAYVYLDVILKYSLNLWYVLEKDLIDRTIIKIGFGKTVLEALSDLCRKVGYKGSKTRNKSFKDILNNRRYKLKI